jgi:Zn-dependent alcohol dehydrogenase
VKIAAVWHRREPRCEYDPVGWARRSGDRRGRKRSRCVPAAVMTLRRQGRFPVEALMTFYDFDQIEQAAQDAEAGRTIKPVLRMS